MEASGSTGSNEGDAPLPSCHGCRTRKLKCSREKPSCSNCTRQAVPCSYDTYRSKPGLKRGTIDRLHKRLESLESKVYAGEDAVPAQPRPSPEDSQLHSTSGAALSLLAQEIQKLSSNISILSKSVASSPETPAPHPHAKLNGSHLRHEKRRRMDDDDDSGELAATMSNDGIDSFPGFSSSLLNGDHLWTIVNVYFTNLHPWMPMIHKETFRHKLRVEDQTQPSLILHAMLFGALRFLDSSGDPLSADHIREMERSRNRVILEATSTLTVSSLQALTIVAFVHIGNGEYSKAWPIIASLSRTVGFLQLSVEEEDRDDPGTFLTSSLLPPSSNWIEEEERRRTFWNIFILDRICCILTGWQVGLTADNVSRRLPLCGTRWNEESFAVSPFFGIWDKSAAKIGNSIAFLPAHYPSPGQSTEASGTEWEHAAAPTARPQSSPKDMPVIGAFAYYIESLESLCRINMYFLQQKIDFSNHQEVSNWLMRFKELDLRLVHWRMFLPPKWRDPNVPPGKTMALDPNMSLAHITHNTSMILLHQRIGYPEPNLKYIKLPSTYSAETCQSAAAETANIASKYLLHAPQHMPLSPFFSFCVYVSARVLLVHSTYYDTELDSQFQVLLDSLRNIAQRWSGSLSHDSSPLLSTQFATHLEDLRDQSLKNADFTVTVIGSLHRGSNRIGNQMQGQVHKFSSSSNARGDAYSAGTAQPADLTSPSQREKSPASSAHAVSATTPAIIPPTTNGEESWTSPSQAPWVASSMYSEPSQLPSILQSLTDQRFIEMDRVISFNDFNFEPVPAQMPQMPPSMGDGWTAGEGGWNQS